MSVNLDSLLRQAVDNHNSGNLQAAESLYREILRHKPSHPDANNLLGMVAFQAGQPEQAIPFIAKAIKKRPKVAEFHRNLGIILATLERDDEALKAFRKALSLKPDFAEVHYNVGNVKYAKGLMEEALAAYRKAIKHHPGYVEAHENMAGIHLVQDQTDEAIAAYRYVLDLAPHSAKAHFNLGSALAKGSRFEEALEAFDQALQADSQYPAAHNNRGNALAALGRLEDALSAYREALELRSDYAEALVNAASVLADLEQMDEAIDFLRRAIELDGSDPNAHFNLANLLVEQGQLDAATASYHQVLRIDPTFADAFHLLMQANKQTDYGEDIKTMEERFQEEGLDEKDKMLMGFGLGKAFEDLKDYDKAFDFLLSANQLKRQSYSYSIEKDKAHFEQIAEMFVPAFLKQFAGAGNPSTTPIFILGMPRSGTSLVEQILASHPMVSGAGELMAITMAYERLKTETAGFDSLSPEDFRQIGNDYLKQLPDPAEGVAHITDKLPHNFLYIGLIKLALPNAKIIHCRRDPVDTCLSIFKNIFIGKHPYAYDLKELGAYYTFYFAMMEHWREVLPGYVHELRYEDMVSDPEPQIRNLLEACGLPFDPACLAFHKTERRVRTVSVSQVRQPIYRDSVKLWEHYRDHLIPLFRALDGH